MSVFTIRLFAVLREKAGRESLELELDAPQTVASLKSNLRRAFPPLAPYLEACRVAVNREFATDARAIAPGDELALIPPVSGG